MSWLLLAAALPGLLWDAGPGTVKLLRQAGIDCIYVPAEKARAWNGSGFCHHAADLTGREKLPVPGVRWEINVASATRAPWVDANGWRMQRLRRRAYWYDLPAGAAPLAAAEAFVYGADAWLRIDPKDLDAFGKMLAFLKRISQGAPDLPPLADIAVIDDGSETMAEVFNLLSRRNLLYRAVSAPDPRYPINVRLGSKEYPQSDAADPAALAQKIRRRLTDEKRLLRVFGSEVVLGYLTGDGSRARLHLLNYGGEKVEGLRLRVRGEYAGATIAAQGIEAPRLEDFAVREGGTEFSIPEMGVYAVVDLSAARM
jgi:hypothetical protein